MYIQLEDQILYYEKKGAGAPILLLHGNGGSHGELDVLAADLENDYTVYALDSRGQGLSADPGELHYRDMAKDVLLFVEALGIRKPAVFGFSDGGIIALLAAMAHPELFSSLMVAGANLSFSGLTFSARRQIKAHWRKTKSPLDELMIKEPDIDPAELSVISCPTLVLAGEHDLVKESETRRIAASLPNAVLQILPGEEHASYVVHSHKLAPLLQKFLTPEAF